MTFLRPENLDELAPVVTDGASRQVGAALKATNLMATRGHDTIDNAIVANYALGSTRGRRN